MARRGKAAPKKDSKASVATRRKGIRKVKDSTPAKQAGPAFQVVWRTAWIDAKGRRAKAPDGEPPEGYRQIAMQMYRGEKGRWTKPSRSMLDAVEVQYQVRYRPTKGVAGRRNEWMTEDEITQDDPMLWLRKMDVARFSREGDKGRWKLVGVVDKDQDLRDLKKADKYRKLQWSEVPANKKISIQLSGRTLAEALGRFVFPVRYGETWAISGVCNVSFLNEHGKIESRALSFSTVEDWYKRYLRDKNGKILHDRNGRPRMDPNSGVYGGDLQGSWRNRVRDEVSKQLRDNRVRFSNPEKLADLWNSGALSKRKKAGFWTYKKAARDEQGKPIPGTACRKWVRSEEYEDKKYGDRLYNDLMSRRQATECTLTLWIERVKIPE